VAETGRLYPTSGRHLSEIAGSPLTFSGLPDSGNRCQFGVYNCTQPCSQNGIPARRG
jgi:hypothetical protein